MSIEEKKISLISWITNIQDEKVLDQVAEIQKSSLADLPDAIVELLTIAKTEPDENLVSHTSVEDLLK